jgi:hypothetical protein
VKGAGSDLRPVPRRRGEVEVVDQEILYDADVNMRRESAAGLPYRAVIEDISGGLPLG